MYLLASILRMPRIYSVRHGSHRPVLACFPPDPDHCRGCLQGSGVNAKAIFFQRTCGSRAVSPKDIEMDLSYGEMMNSPLEDFDRALGQVFLPLLKKQEEWGKCRGDADANALFESAAALRKTLDEAILNVNAGKSSHCLCCWMDYLHSLGSRSKTRVA